MRMRSSYDGQLDIDEYSYANRGMRDRQPYSDLLVARLNLNLEQRKKIYKIFDHNLVVDDATNSFEEDEEVESLFGAVDHDVFTQCQEYTRVCNLRFDHDGGGYAYWHTFEVLEVKDLVSAAQIVLQTKEIVSTAVSEIAKKKSLNDDSKRKLTETMMGTNYLMMNKEDFVYAAKQTFLSLGQHGGKFSDYEKERYQLSNLNKDQISSVFNAMQILPESRHRLAKDNTQFPAKLIELNKEKLSIRDIAALGERLLAIKKSEPKDSDAKNPEQSESMKQIAKILKEKIKAEEKAVGSGKPVPTPPDDMKAAVALIRLVDPKYQTKEEKKAAKEAEKKLAAERPSGMCAVRAVVSRLVGGRSAGAEHGA